MLLRVYIIFLALSANLIMVFSVVIVISSVVIAAALLTPYFFRCGSGCHFLSETVVILVKAAPSRSCTAAVVILRTCPVHTLGISPCRTLRTLAAAVISPLSAAVAVILSFGWLPVI